MAAFVPLSDALRELLRAWRLAEVSETEPTTFAVRLHVLRQLGATNTDLRWLVLNDYAHHWIDVSAASRLCDRTLLQADSEWPLTDRSCFVLTEAGYKQLAALMVVELKEEPLQGGANGGHGLPDLLTPSAQIPHWHDAAMKLEFQGRIVKRLKASAHNQRLILQAFQEEGWPPRIDDPLPPVQNVDPKERLREVAKSLNRYQRYALLHFGGDGNGTGICWSRGKRTESPDPYR